MVLVAAITRKAFTNESPLDRHDRELIADRDRIDRQRSGDRKADGDRLDRIETDIRSKRDMLFDAFQRGRVAQPIAGLSVWAGIGSSGFYRSTEASVSSPQVAASSAYYRFPPEAMARAARHAAVRMSAISKPE